MNKNKTIRPTCFDLFDTSPNKAIAKAFGEMRTIKQADMKSPDGEIIDLSFFRNIGLPVNQDWGMEEWHDTFNTIHDEIPTAMTVLEANFPGFSEQLQTPEINILKNCLCLQFLRWLSPNGEDYELKCIDLQNHGALYLLELTISNAEWSIQSLFINSSFEQYMKTLALYVNYRNEWLPPTVDEFAFGNDLFEEYIKQIDNSVLQGEYYDTFWSRVVELLRYDEVGYNATDLQ